MNKYKGVVLKVIDGDTFDLMVELGFGVVQKFRVRLAGVDAPEKRTEEGVRVTELVRNEIEDKTVFLTDKGKEKYGRALAKIELMNGKDLTELLIENGWGKEYDGGKRNLVTMFCIE